MQRVIGFAGWPRAGKSDAADYLQRTHSAQRFEHSDFIRRLAVTQGNHNPATDELSAIFEAQAKKEGYGWIAKQVQDAVLERRRRNPETLVVVSGVRNLAEVDVYQELDGFLLVKIEADFDVRLARARKCQRMGETGLTPSRFRAIEALAGNANIPDLMALPGSTIVNNGTNKVDFHRALDRLLGTRFL